MKPCRLHIFGASGTGVSTLGRAMADAWSVPFHDTDDYFWHPTEPPYRDRRTEAERLTLMHQMFVPRSTWVLSGSLIGWGDPLIPMFDAVVFLTLDLATRLNRLRQREAGRTGAAAIAPGGADHTHHRAFMDWAARYDDPAFTGRSLKRQREWLAKLPSPALELDAARPTHGLVASVLSA